MEQLLFGNDRENKLSADLPASKRVVALTWRIGFFLIGKSCKIIHAGIQGARNSLALFKGVISLSGLDFRIIALVNAGQHLHLYLCKTPFLPQIFKSSQFQECRCSVEHPNQE